MELATLGALIPDVDFESTAPRLAVGHGPLARLGPIACLPLVTATPRALIAELGGDAVLTYSRMADGRMRSRYLPRSRAIEELDSGTTTELGDLHVRFELLQQWLVRLRAELGIWPRGWCVGTVSPEGSGVPFHFDHSEVLVVQLAGEKRWWVAPNTRVAFPTASYFLEVDGAPRATMTPSYFPSCVGEPIEDDSISTFVMRPGSALFVPRGWWHRTEALTDSTSIILSLGGPSVAEAVMARLLEALLEDEAARRPLVGAVGTPEQRRRAARMVDDFLAQARALLDSAVGGDFVAEDDAVAQPRERQ